MLLNVGGAPEMVKTTGWLVPYTVVTITSRAPRAASAAIENVAVAVVELMKLTLVTVIPGMAATARSEPKSIPVSVTLTFAF